MKTIATRLVDYLKASRTEMRKVVWPSRSETIQYTLLVIGVSLAVAAFMGLFDYVFNLLVQQII